MCSFRTQFVIAATLLLFATGFAYAQPTPELPKTPEGYHLEGCTLDTSASAKWTGCTLVYDKPAAAQAAAPALQQQGCPGGFYHESPYGTVCSNAYPYAPPPMVYPSMGYPMYSWGRPALVFHFRF